LRRQRRGSDQDVVRGDRLPEAFELRAQVGGQSGRVVVEGQDSDPPELPSSGKITVAQGAATSCYVATAPALAGVSGRFFQECNPVVPDARARDGAAAARLWGVSEGLVAAYLG